MTGARRRGDWGSGGPLPMTALGGGLPRPRGDQLERRCAVEEFGDRSVDGGGNPDMCAKGEVLQSGKQDKYAQAQCRADKVRTKGSTTGRSTGPLHQACHSDTNRRRN